MFKTIFKGTVVEFRYRFLIFMTLYCIGFFSPWITPWFWLVNKPYLRSWLQLMERIMHAGVANYQVVGLGITGAAVLCMTLAAVLRVWAAAYMVSSVVHDTAMRSGQVVADGPYRYMRNPLYLAGPLMVLGLGILMPISGAIFTLVATTIFALRLIGGEEAFLSEKLGAPYVEYLQKVPRIVPSLTPRVPAGGKKAAWGQAIAGEVFPVGAAICYAMFAWQFNANLLGRSILVVLGVSLVVRALLKNPNA